MTFESSNRSAAPEWLIIPDSERVRRLRQQKGWTQQELAGESGVSKRTIERIENAQRRGFSFHAHTLSDVAAALGVPLPDIIERLDPGTGCEPDPEPVDLVPVTLPAGGDAAFPGGAEAPLPVIAEEIVPAPAKSPVAAGRSRRRTSLILALVLLTLLLGAAWRQLEPVRALLGTPVAHPALPDKPSLVVLPFRDVSQVGNEYLAAAITREVTDAIATIPGFFVVADVVPDGVGSNEADLRRIGRELGVRYVLHGEILPGAGGRATVRAALSEAESGALLWTQRFPDVSGDRTDVTANMVESIAIATRVRLEQEQLQRIRRKRTEDLTAYDLVMRASLLMRRGRRQDVESAKALLDRAIARDPDFADAYALKGAALSMEAMNHWNGDGRLVDEAASEAHHALELDPMSVQAHLTLSATHLFRGQTSLALEQAQVALRFDPNSDWGYALLGMAQAQSGDVLAGAENVNRAIRLNPRQPTTLLMAVALIRFAAGYRDEAAALLEQAVESNPDVIGPRVLLASYYDKRGRHADAHEQVDRVLELRPDFTVAEALTLFPRAESLVGAATLEGFASRLRTLGLP